MRCIIQEWVEKSFDAPIPICKIARKLEYDEVMAVIDEGAVNRAIKIGACNIYHGCVHNMLYEKSEDILRGLYKSASFVVQAIAFKQTGNYISHQKELLQVVSSDERDIVCLVKEMDF